MPLKAKMFLIWNRPPMLAINIDRGEVKATMSVTTDSTPSSNFKLKMRVKILILPLGSLKP